MNSHQLNRTAHSEDSIDRFVLEQHGGDIEDAFDSQADCGIRVWMGIDRRTARVGAAGNNKAEDARACEPASRLASAFAWPPTFGRNDPRMEPPALRHVYPLRVVLRTGRRVARPA